MNELPLADLPWEGLLSIALPQQRHRTLVAMLKRAMQTSNGAVALMEGQAVRQLNDRHRATHLVCLVTDEETLAASHLRAWSFKQIGHSLFHGWVPIIIHLVGVPSLNGGQLHEVQEGLLAWEPDAPQAQTVLALLDDRTAEIGEAITQCGAAYHELCHASGQLAMIGPRKWRLHLGREKILEYLRQQGKI